MSVSNSDFEVLRQRVKMLEEENKDIKECMKSLTTSFNRLLDILNKHTETIWTLPSPWCKKKEEE